MVVAQLIEWSLLNPSDLQFESSHQQKFILNIYCLLHRKDENKEIEASCGPTCFKIKIIKIRARERDDLKGEHNFPPFQNF